MCCFPHTALLQVTEKVKAQHVEIRVQGCEDIVIKSDMNTKIKGGMKVAIEGGVGVDIKGAGKVSVKGAITAIG